MCRLSWNLGAWTSWNPQGQSRLFLHLTSKIIVSVMSITEWWSRIYNFCHAQTYAAVGSGTRQAMYIKLNVEASSLNVCCRGQAINITYSECVSLALVIQHAKGMHRTMSFVVSLAAPYFSILSHKGTIFFKKKRWLNVKCVFWFPLQLCLKSSHPKKNSATYYHKCI